MPESTNQLNGFLIINKPRLRQGFGGQGRLMTSHDVVNYVRQITGIKQVGHAGTLDPFATGVLIIGIGKTTRLLEYAKDLPKTYEAEITLGATSDTDDVTGKITAKPGASPYEGEAGQRPGEVQILETLKTFLGPIQQIPPAYSAVKVHGKKLYEIARSGNPADLSAVASAKAEAQAKAGERGRIVNMYSINLLSYEYPHLKIEVNCGSGTYIRALGRDIGEKLGTGGYVSHLQRKSIGTFHISQAISLDKLSTDNLTASLLPWEKLVEHFPSITLSPENVAKFQQGQVITLAAVQPRGEAAWSLALLRGELYGVSTPIAVFDESHDLIGIGKLDPTTSLASPKPSAKAGLLHPQKVL